MATTVTSKGQVTIPKPVREMLGITAGTAVEFEVAPDGRVVLRRADARRRRSRFEKARGMARGTMTTDEIMALTRGDAYSHADRRGTMIIAVASEHAAIDDSILPAIAHRATAERHRHAPAGAPHRQPNSAMRRSNAMRLMARSASDCRCRIASSSRAASAAAR